MGLLGKKLKILKKRLMKGGRESAKRTMRIVATVSRNGSMSAWRISLFVSFNKNSLTSKLFWIVDNCITNESIEEFSSCAVVCNRSIHRNSLKCPTRFCQINLVAIFQTNK